MSDEDDKAPDRYGVMGYPISHSRSPVIHRLFATQTGENIDYELLKVSPKNFESSVRSFQRGGGKGLNITVPHKTEATKVVDHMSDRAATAGAINTLIFKGGEIHGDNTDGIGLLRDLAVNLGVTIEDANILVFGAGGATSGIVGPLLEMRPKSLVIANRTLERAQALADHFSRFGPASACRLDNVPEAADIVINATSAGLKGELPPYPGEAVNPDTFCYDLSYALSPTPFCEWARKAGADRIAMGWGMLVEQAAESFHLWRGIMPDTAPILSRMKVSV